jgi:cardiolipin synthase (CMP-forming)
VIRDLATIPNILSISRLLLIPFLWILALQGHAFAVAVGVIIAALTDTLDGVLARRLGQVSELGSKLDSLADNLLKPSVLAWLLILVPEILANHAIELLAAGVAYAATITIGLVRFKRFGNLHLYSGKVGSVVQYVFIFHALVFTGYEQTLFYLAVGMFLFSSMEAILIMLTRSEVDEHIGSIFKSRMT